MSGLRQYDQNAMAQISRQLPALGEEMRAQDFTGSALDGSVTATVNGLGTLRDITICVLAKRENDRFTLGEAVVSAVQQAEATAREALIARFGALTLAGRTLEETIPDFLGKLTGGDSHR